MRIIVDKDFRDSEIAVADIATTFAEYPHIARKVLPLWGTKECREFLRKLSMNEDRPPRKEALGFPFALALKILEVLEAHDRAFPEFSTQAVLSRATGWDSLPSRW